MTGPSRRALLARGGAALLSAGGVALLGACSPAGTPGPSPSVDQSPGSASGSSASPSPTTSAASPSPPISASATGPATVGTPTDLVTGLKTPWGLAVLPDGGLLVSERDTGHIKRIGQGSPAIVTTVGDVKPTSEGGLLGLALSPDGSQLYAYATTARDNRVLRMAWDGTKLGAPQVLLDGIPYASNHDGGRLGFGPDGMLYVSTGDAAVRSNAQDRNSLAGKILRLTPDGKAAPGNPFNNPVWSYGHRNVQGLAWDDRGRLWASEFGQNTQDELNLIERGGNYGWPEIEGNETKLEGRINPVRVWRTDDASPSGLAFARGSLWMAALRGGRLWEIPLSGDGTAEPKAHFTGTYGRLRSVVAVADGLLLSTSNTDGRGTVRNGDDRILRVPLT